MTTQTPPPTKAPQSLYPIATDVLAALAFHRVLDTSQVHRLVLPDKTATWARKVLSDLRELGFASNMRQRQNGPHRNLPDVWWATKEGVDAAREIPTIRHARLVVMTEEKVAAGTQQHTLAVNETCLCMTHAARARGDNASWVNEVAHRTTTAGASRDQYATADALLTLDTTTSTGKHNTLRVLVELDRGSKPYDRIAQQMRRYLTYRRLMTTTKPPVPAWHSRYAPIPSAPVQGFPMVLWVFDCPGADRRMAAFADLLTDSTRNPDLAAAGDELWVLLTTAERLHAMGPYAPAFLDVYAGEAVTITGSTEPVTPAPFTERRTVTSDRRSG